MPQSALQGPAFSTRTPDVVNSAGKLTLSIPILNTGDAAAADVTITGLSLGAAARLEPVLPLVVGDVAAANVIALSPTFSINGLVVGGRYVVAIRGTYRSGNVAYGVMLNRYITVPAAIAPPVSLLAAHVTVAVDAIVGAWAYTLRNDESSSSPRCINAISLDMAAPFTVTGTPPGWAADTDNVSYVLWYAIDTALPYPHHIAPGSSRGGFQIYNQSGQRTSEAKPYSIRPGTTRRTTQTLRRWGLR